MADLMNNPWNLKQEIKICNVALNAMGNPYSRDDTFTQWDFNPAYSTFECVMACCFVQIFCKMASQIRKPN